MNNVEVNFFFSTNNKFKKEFNHVNCVKRELRKGSKTDSVKMEFIKKDVARRIRLPIAGRLEVVSNYKRGRPKMARLKCRYQNGIIRLCIHLTPSVMEVRC